MCVLALAWRVRDELPLMLVGNRDEYFERPTEALHWWPDHGIWAGRDQRAGGTWLAVAPGGRFAAVTNIRGAGDGAGTHSRGELPLRALQYGPAEMATHVAEYGAGYGGFNLIFGGPTELYLLSNRLAGLQRPAPGVHGLSNAALNTPWPKVTAARAGLARAAAQPVTPQTPELMRLLAGRSVAVPARLPQTGLPLDAERRLSAAFVVSPHYGTRCTTALLLAPEGHGVLVERRFDATGTVIGETRLGIGR